MKKEYLVRWCKYDQESTEYGTWFDPQPTEAESEEEAIELVKQWIFDENNKEEYPRMEITKDGIDLGNGTEYRCFNVKCDE